MECIIPKTFYLLICYDLTLDLIKFISYLDSYSNTIKEKLVWDIYYKFFHDIYSDIEDENYKYRIRRFLITRKLITSNTNVPLDNYDRVKTFLKTPIIKFYIVL